MLPQRVLLVDDSPEFLASTRRYLQARAAVEIVGVASSGEEAVQKALELRPDLVMMDLYLPGINGIEATRRIKQGNPQIRILVFSFYDLDEYALAARAAGAEALIPKSRLADEFDQLMENPPMHGTEPGERPGEAPDGAPARQPPQDEHSPGPGQAASSGALGPGQAPQILVVDDSPTIRKMVMAALRPLGASFVEAGNGLEAIEQLALNEFSAITLDLNMPDVHGLEVLAYIRKAGLEQKLRVVVLTTRDDAETERAAQALGARRYLTKPFTSSELLAVMRELLA